MKDSYIISILWMIFIAGIVYYFTKNPIPIVVEVNLGNIGNNTIPV